MIPYVIFYILIFLLSFKIKKNKFDIYDIFMLEILIVFSSIRYGIGTDYFLYQRIYLSSRTHTILASDRTGIGFSVLERFFSKTLNLDYTYFVAFCAIITIICFYIFFKKNSNKPGRSILIFVALSFYTSSFNAFRQYLSLSIILIGYIFFQDKKYIKSIILFIISVSFHSSAIIPIALYLIILILKKIEIKTIYVIILSIILYFLYDPIFNLLINNSNAYAIYEYYDLVPGIGTYLIVLFYYSLYFFLIVPNRKKIDVSHKKYLNLISIGICVLSLQLHNWLFSRASSYFMIFLPIILSDYYDKRFNVNSKLEKIIFHLLLFVYFFAYVRTFGGVYPYKSIFSINIWCN